MKNIYFNLINFLSILALSYSATNAMASDSASGVGPQTVTPTTSQGYVLARGTYFPPNPATSNLSTTLYMPTNGKQCAPNTIPTVTIAMSNYYTWNNYNISNIEMSTYQYGSSNVWSGYSTATWLGNQYAIGLSTGFLSNGSSWWATVGVTWTLYCMPP